jgi:hypothetical protein
MAEPLLHLGDVGLMIERVGRGATRPNAKQAHPGGTRLSVKAQQLKGPL